MLKSLEEGGDRHTLVQFYDGAKVFDPKYAKNMSNDDAKKLIDKLGIYQKLGEGENLLQLNKGWRAYKSHVQRFFSSLENDGDILS